MFFFGNLASIIENIAPILKSQMQSSYKKVNDTLKTLSLESFQERIDVLHLFIIQNYLKKSSKKKENEPISYFIFHLEILQLHLAH